MSSPPNDDPTPPARTSRGASAPIDDPAWAPTQRIVPVSGPRWGNALPMATRLDEFELLRVLGEGGFGIVYLAQDHSLRRRVAIKEFMPSALASRVRGLQVELAAERNRPVFNAGLASFINEAQMLAKFDHPSLVKVYRFWQAHGTAYMVMPYYEGATLKVTLEHLPGAPDERWLMALLAALTEALAVIHADHCLHRDIAPDNILLLAGSGRPLLLDFGAARQVIGDATQALTAILKPGYAPIEQYAELASLRQGPWTDVYALCAVIYAALMGHKPPVSVGRTVADSYVPLSQSAAGRYSVRFLQAIDDGLKVRPDERTASIAALRRALGLNLAAGAANFAAPAAAAPGQPAQAVPVQPGLDAAPQPVRPAGQPLPPSRSPFTSSPSSPSTWPTRSIALVLGALLLAAGSGYWVWAGQQPAPTSPPATTTAAVTVTAATTAGLLPAAAPTAARTTVSDEFDRIVQASSSDFLIEASPAQPRLRIGRDRLAFKVKSARDGHVYVLVGGPDGSLLLLYPNSQAPQHQIRAGQTLRLPQAHWQLDTTEPTGAEHFLVLVSQHPRDFSRLSQQRDAWFLKLPTGAAGDAALRGHVGPGSALAGSARCSQPGCDVYGTARFTVDVVN